MNLQMKKEQIENMLYENGMGFFDDYEKIDINEDTVDVYKIDDVYCILFFDLGDSFGWLDVVENYDDIKTCIGVV